MEHSPISEEHQARGWLYGIIQHDSGINSKIFPNFITSMKNKQGKKI